jgi:hypothetical protein
MVPAAWTPPDRPRVPQAGIIAAMARSFFKYWMDTDYRQRDDIDQLAFETEVVSDSVVRVTKQVAGLRTQVQELSAAVAVLLRMLAEKGELDPAELERRVDAEIAVRCAPKPQPPVVCIRCKKSVPANTTMITGDGVVCDPSCA